MQIFRKQTALPFRNFAEIYLDLDTIILLSSISDIGNRLQRPINIRHKQDQPYLRFMYKQRLYGANMANVLCAYFYFLIHASWENWEWDGNFIYILHRMYITNSC